MKKIMAERHKTSWPSKGSKTGMAHARKKRWPVPDKGAPGKTPASKKWKKGPFARISGYKISSHEKTRHARLVHAMISRGGGRSGCRSVFRELVALHNINTSPKAKAVFRADANWIGKKYGYHMK